MRANPDENLIRPPILLVLLAICILLGVVLIGLGGVFLIQPGGLRPALYLGFVGFILTAGAIGVYQGKHWETALSGMLAGISFVAMLFLLFALIVGRNEFSVGLTVGAALTAIVPMFLAFRLRGQDIMTYLWALRISQSEASLNVGCTDEVTLDFGADQEVEAPQPQPEESTAD